MEGEGYHLEENFTAFCGLSVNDLALKEELFGVVTFSTFN
jgi:hypothetical protein